MADTQVIERDLTPDTSVCYRLTEEAVQRLMDVLDVTEIDELGTRIGFPARMTFWRLRTCGIDIRLSAARRLATIAGWPLDAMFVEVPRG